MILSISDVAELKRTAAEKFSVNIHFCDACGGQSFTVENPTEEVKAYIISFFSEKGLRPDFSEDGRYFTVKRDS